MLSVRNRPQSSLSSRPPQVPEADGISMALRQGLARCGSAACGQPTGLGRGAYSKRRYSERPSIDLGRPARPRPQHQRAVSLLLHHSNGLPTMSSATFGAQSVSRATGIGGPTIWCPDKSNALCYRAGAGDPMARPMLGSSRSARKVRTQHDSRAPIRDIGQGGREVQTLSRVWLREEGT